MISWPVYGANAVECKSNNDRIVSNTAIKALTVVIMSK